MTTSFNNASFIVRCTSADGTVTREVYVYGDKTPEQAEVEARKTCAQDGVNLEQMTVKVMARLLG